MPLVPFNMLLSPVEIDHHLNPPIPAVPPRQVEKDFGYCLSAPKSWNCKFISVSWLLESVHQLHYYIVERDRQHAWVGKKSFVWRAWDAGRGTCHKSYMTIYYFPGQHDKGTVGVIIYELFKKRENSHFIQVWAPWVLRLWLEFCT